MIAIDTSWKEHIFKTVARANRMLSFLKRNCVGLVDGVALLRLFCSLVLSHLFYFAQVWAPQSVANELS